MTRKSLILSLVVASVMSSPVLASETPQPVQQHNSNAVWFENFIGLSNTQMTISYPDGTLETVFAKTGTPVFQLTGAEVVDGIYRYELTAATNEKQTIKNPIDNGRGAAASNERAVPFSMSGQFVVSRGVIVTPDDLKEDN
ncbi:hypothetical protein GCM10007385_44220 [Tateyamaria omphalii]|uniref:hypothetical protein n=1 Tax=Tateyamaria omphalii TaxID=299262 RepID=UPI001673472F|nr:hypothetical protein [Tateyamaria omphalii]GGX70372.1 hypothetical protein GCM10007385_44220 [Tateyamaria omphalii]